MNYDRYEKGKKPLSGSIAIERTKPILQVPANNPTTNNPQAAGFLFNNELIELLLCFLFYIPQEMTWIRRDF